MATEYKLSYTASEIDKKLGQIDNLAAKDEIPTKTSQLTNDSGFITGYTETDPTVPAWAKSSVKPSYSKSEVGLGNVDNVKQYSANNPPPYPVTSVNGKVGAVTLDASAVGARPSSWTPSYSDVGAEKSGTVAAAVSSHNTSTSAHNDIRLLVDGLSSRVNALANSTDEDLDQMAEIVAYIKNNKTLIDNVTTSKVSVADIINNLTTNVSNKPLSAAQGVALKALIDALENDKLDASTLSTAISTALAQAKASGEFDGEDGVSATHKWNGTVLTVTSASGTSSADLKGNKGDSGVYMGSVEPTDPNVVVWVNPDGEADGLDYVLTDEDKNEIADIVKEEVPFVKTAQLPIFVNSIEECTDTTKLYVLPDGFIYAYQYVETTGPSYTNLAGTITYDKRLSSSGKASSSAMPGACYTDFIPVKKGDIVRIKNLNIYDNLSSSAYPYICFYTGASESNVTTTSPTYIVPDQHVNAFNGLADTVSGGVASWIAFVISITGTTGVQHTNAALTHIRISGKYFADKEVIVTVNEEIKEGGSAGGYQWVNTGHAFVPADYESEILALQKNKADKTAIPTKLPNPNALTIDGVPYDGSSAVNIETQSGGNILYGKKWVACGDSFTANGYNASDGFDESVYIYQDGRFAGRYKVYPNIIGLRNNMNIVNLATGGQTMSASSNSFMTRYANIDADADYITIMLGINDKIQGIPVGTLEDSVNTTFCGAFNIAMEHILENHPFAHIGIMVSHGTNAEIMTATRGIAERWGVPYLDYGSPQVPLMNRYTGRNVCAKAQEIREKNFCVASDGTTATNGHPNTAAHEYESTFIEAWLRTL